MKIQIKRICAIALSFAMLTSVLNTGLIASASDAKTVYVNAAATADSDGTSADKGYKTIADGIAQLSTGDTLIIETGEYAEPMKIGNLTGVTIRAEGSVELTGTTPTDLSGWGADYPSVLNITGSDSVDISGITFAYSPDSSSHYGSAAIIADSQNINLHGNRFIANKNAGACIQPNVSSTITLDGNTIGGECSRGIWVPWGMNTCKITNNVIKNARGLDIACDAGYPSWQGSISGNIIENNTFLGSMAGSTESSDKFTGNTVANNIFSNAMVTVGSYVSGQNTFANNCYNVQDQNQAGITLSSSDIVGNPLFADATNGDYHLTSDSHCIGTGSFDYLPATDYAGEARTTADIGAYRAAAPSGKALTVTSNLPQGSTVDAASTIKISLNDMIATPSDIASHISVTSGGATVDGNCAVSRNAIIFTPSSKLAYSTAYTVKLTAGFSGMDYGALANDFTWTFTTQNDPTVGVTYYVAPNGDNSNPGTIDKPKKTVQSFASTLKPGDSVIYRAGTYDGNVVLQNKGSSSGQPITFKPYNGEKVTLTYSDGGFYIYYIGNCQNIRIEGLTFSGIGGNSRSNAIDIDDYDNSLQQPADITVTKCKFIDCSSGIILRNVNTSGADQKFGNLEISNNVIMASNPAAKLGTGLDFQEVRVQDGCYAKVFNNVIENASKGIYLWGRSENLLVYNNTFLDTYDEQNYSGEYDLYQVQGFYNTSTYSSPQICHNCTFKNNIFTKPIYTQSQNDGIMLDSKKGNVFDSNVYASNSMQDYVTYNGQGDGPKYTFTELQGQNYELHGVYAPVNFVDSETDGRLSGADNKAITAATATIVDGVSAPATDINGAVRTNEAGCFAYDNSLSFVGANSSGAPDGTYTNPYPTISAAISANKTNINIKPGSYSEDGLAIPAGTTIAPYSSGVTVTGAVTITGSQESPTSVSGMKFDGTVTLSGSGIKLLADTFSGAVNANNATGISIEKSHFASANSDGVAFDAVTDSKILNCIFESRLTAIDLKSGSTGNVIYNNTFIGNANDINLDTGADGNTVKNNIFTAQNNNGGTENAFGYNCYDTQTLSSDYLSNINETGCVKADPQFINLQNKDYRLNQSSPCVGAGTKDANTPSNDIEGNGRTEPLDIGAYAYTKVDYSFYVSANGDDNNAGTESNPFKTIGKAVQAVKAGQAVIVAGGIYNEDIAITGKVGDSANGIIIKNADGETVTVTGTVTIGSSAFVTLDGINVHAASDKTAETVTSSPNITVENADITGETGISVTGSDSFNTSAVNIHDVNIGISSSASTIAITRTKIKNASSAALSAASQSKVSLTSSIILDSAKGVIGTDESAFAVVNNTFYNVSGLNIDISQTNHDTQLNLYNNIYSRAATGQGAYIQITKAANGFNTENNIYNAAGTDPVGIVNGNSWTLKEMQDEDGDDTQSIAADPSFKNATDENFSPVKGSPAARAGTAAPGAPSIDFNGSAFASVYDIGAIYSPYTLKTIYVAGYQCAWSDGNGSYDAPFQSLKQALSVARSSDTIVVCKGVYKEGRIDLNYYNGVDDARITIKGDSSPDNYWNQAFDERNPDVHIDRPVFIGKDDYDTWSVKASTDLFMKIEGCSYVTLEGFDIAGFTDAGVWVDNSNNINLDDLHIWNIDHQETQNSGVEGVLVNSSQNCNFTNLTIWNVGLTRKSQADHGMYIGGVSNCVFSDIVVDNAPGAGIQFYHGDNYDVHATNVTVENNIFAECRYGLIVCGVQDSTFTNNTFVNNKEDDLYLDWGTNHNTFQNNIFYNDYGTSQSGVAPTVIARHSGSGVNKVLNNTFTNSIYQYKYFEPTCQEGWTTKYPIADYMKSQNDGTLNTFTNVKPGSVNFVDGMIDKTKTADAQALSIREDGIFRIFLNSDCVDFGAAAGAPASDIAGTTRKDNPDVGAYEAVDVRKITLTNSTIAENNKTGDKIGSLKVFGLTGTPTITYKLASGDGSNDNDAFTISGDGLFAAKAFDYETKNTYKVCVQADIDGQPLVETLIVQIENVEEQPKIDKTMKYITSSITVDGDLSESDWNNQQLQNLTVASDNVRSDFTAKMGLLANAQNLYIGAKITDSDVVNHINQGSDFNGDIIEVYIDGLNREASSYDNSTVQFMFEVNDSTLHVYGNSNSFSTVHFVMKKTDDGYTLEACIPWSELGVTFNMNNTIGFAADVQDYDSDGNFGTLALVPVDGFWKDKSQWPTYGFVQDGGSTGGSTGNPTPTGDKVISGSAAGTGSSFAAKILPTDASTAAGANIVVNLNNLSVSAPASLFSGVIGSDNASWVVLAQNNTPAETQIGMQAEAYHQGLMPVLSLDLDLTRCHTDGTSQAVHQLGGEATVTLSLTDTQIAAIQSAGGAHLFYYDPTTKSLTDMNAVFDLSKKTVTFKTSHFSTYVVAAEKSAPVITGVENNGVYNSDRTITFSAGTATLDTNAFTSGGRVSTEGKHILVVTDSLGNTTTFAFTIDKTAPVVSGITSNGVYKSGRTVTFSDGTATLDGKAFTSGSTIGADGKHVFVVTDAAGNSNKFSFVIDSSSPVIKTKTGSKTVKNGGISSGSVVLSVSDLFSVTKAVTLNGKTIAWPKNSVFSTDGRYIVTIKDQYGQTAKVTFTVDKTAPKITAKRVKGSVAVAVSEANLLTKVVTLNGKKLAWPSNGKFTKKGRYVVTVTDKAGYITTGRFII